MHVNPCDPLAQFLVPRNARKATGLTGLVGVDAPLDAPLMMLVTEAWTPSLLPTALGVGAVGAAGSREGKGSI